MLNLELQRQERRRELLKGDARRTTMGGEVAAPLPSQTSNFLAARMPGVPAFHLGLLQHAAWCLRHG